MAKAHLRQCIQATSSHSIGKILYRIDMFIVIFTRVIYIDKLFII